MSDENNSRDKNYRFAIAHLLILILFAYMGFFGNFQIADHMAKNPDNIIKGCMYYVREVRRGHRDATQVKIDGRLYETYLIYTNKSEIFSSKKYGEFDQYMKDNPELCHPIGYIELVNLGFYKKIYVYHYYGDFNLN